MSLHVPSSPLAASTLTTSSVNALGLSGAATAAAVAVKWRQRVEEPNSLSASRRRDVQGAFLRMGDLVSLYSSDSHGYLVSEGFSDRSCGLRLQEPDAVPRDHNEAVFEILPRFRYESRAALARFAETHRLAMAEGGTHIFLRARPSPSPPQQRTASSRS